MGGGPDPIWGFAIGNDGTYCSPISLQLISWNGAWMLGGGSDAARGAHDAGAAGAGGSNEDALPFVKGAPRAAAPP